MTDKHKILLIEDNPGDARLIQEMLSEASGVLFDLECAGRLSTGLERLAEGGIDVVLLDLGLPDSWGVDTFARVHAQAPQVPIVVLTGLNDIALATRAVREGAQDYLVKNELYGNLLVRSTRYAIERKWAQERIRRLNSVLKAVRTVNQLIVAEKDRDRLLQKACDALIETRGYEAAWIGSLSDGEIFATVQGCGFRKDISRFCEHVIGSDHPPCIKSALAQGGRLVIVDRYSVCKDCFFKSMCTGKEAAIVRIEHADRLFSLLAILFAGDVTADDEEKELLKEVAGDLALGLHNMELEEAHRRAEETLRESKNRYERLYSMVRLMCDNLPDLIWTKDLEGKFVFANKACCEKLLNAQDTDEPIGKTDRYFASREKESHPENPDYHTFGEICTGSDLAVLESQRPQRFDEFGNVKGELLFLNIYKAPFWDENGDVIGTVGCARIVTKEKQMDKERKRAEEALRRSEEQLRLVVQNMPVMLDAFDADSNTIAWNRECERVTGYSANEIICNPKALELLYPDTAYLQQTLAEWTEHGNAFRGWELELTSKDGSVKTVLWTNISEQFPIPGWASWSIGVDITERKKAEEARTRLMTAIEQSAESVVITNVEGTILYVNPVFEQITGYSRAEVLGQNPHILKSGKQDTALYEELWATISAGKVWQGRFVNRKKDGTLYTEDTVISPVRNESGVIVSYVAVKRDVTRELQLEEQYRQAQKMEAMGRLAGGVAHDFNNLLTAIQGYTELLLEDLTPADPMHADLQEIKKASDRAAALTQQLLAFSHKQVLRPQALDLNTVLTDLEKMLRRLISEDIELITALDPELGLVKADPGQIEQVIVNLAVNARDAMPQGGRLTIKTANVMLDETYAREHLEARPGAHVMLTVTDTGVGMDKEVKSHLFEPFFTTKEAGKGTGLGLSTVYGIVTQSKGHVEVYSELGRGTTFKIYLPCVKETDAPVKREQAPDALLRGTETVLLVEDEDMVRELAGRVLRRCGYTVLEARHPGEALLRSEKHTGAIQLLVTDVVMPGMGGRELAERLTQLRPEMKVLYISGYADDILVHRSILEPGVAFLQKPFTPVALAYLMRQVLD